MSASNDFPAQGSAAQPVTYPQFVAGVAPGGDVHQARPPVPDEPVCRPRDRRCEA